jgi:hypothetical protein
MDKVALGQALLRKVPFSSVITIPPISVYTFFLPERASWRKLGTFHTASPFFFGKFWNTAQKGKEIPVQTY